MSVQTQIDRINSAKTAIGAAIAGKGVTVPSGTKIDGMAALIGAIESGGGSGGEDDFLKVVERTITELSGTNITKVGSYAFCSCSTLKKVNLPNCKVVGSNAFTACSSMTDASIPACTVIWNVAFQSTKLSRAFFPECTSISSHAFQKTSLTEVDFPKLSRVGEYVFGSCSLLTTISFPKLETIAQHAFASCTKLNVARFNACKSINRYAFYRCTSLSALIIDSSSVCYLASSVFMSTPIAFGSGYIYVPSSLVASYQSATNWAAFSGVISAIEDSEFA